MKTKEETLLEMLECCFKVDINLNDTFYYACADSEEINAEDFVDLIPLAQKYGAINAVLAFCAVKREQMGEVKNLEPIGINKRKEKKNFRNAKKEIETIIKDPNFEQFFELSWDVDERKKELEEFGELIEWHHSTLKTGLVLRTATLPKQKIYGVGTSINDTVNDLRKKLKESKEIK